MYVCMYKNTRAYVMYIQISLVFFSSICDIFRESLLRSQPQLIVRKVKKIKIRKKISIAT